MSLAQSLFRSPPPPAPPGFDPTKYKTAPCRNVDCPYGAKCKFLHDDDTDPSLTKPDHTDKRVCRYYPNCERGETCPFIHPDEKLNKKQMCIDAFHIAQSAMFSETKTNTILFLLLQNEWRNEHHKYTIVGNLHQNSIEDKLHLSFNYTSGTAHIKLHVYGYLNNGFKMTHMTACDKGKIETIAEYA